MISLFTMCLLLIQFAYVLLKRETANVHLVWWFAGAILTLLAISKHNTGWVCISCLFLLLWTALTGYSLLKEKRLEP